MSYILKGKHRKLIKKELSDIESRIKYFWYLQDINFVYGCELSKDEAEKRYLALKCNRKQLKNALNAKD